MISFKNKVIKAELIIDPVLYDFLEDYVNGAINDVSFNDQTHSLLVECDYYKKSSPEQNNPLTPQQEQYVVSLEAIISDAQLRDINEIELSRG